MIRSIGLKHRPARKEYWTRHKPSFGSRTDADGTMKSAGMESSVGETSASTHTHTRVELDVLILGGGVQGLWLLTDLRNAGYTAALVDPNPIGGAQTLHSHGFIHFGHAYPHVYSKSSGYFAKARSSWEKFLSDNRHVAGPPQPAFVGFLSLANALFWEDAWQASGLRFEKLLNLPTQFHNSALECVYTTPQRRISPALLVKHLATTQRPAIVHGRPLSAKISQWGPQIKSVEVLVRTAKGDVGFCPRALVVAAGAGNDGLLLTLGLANAFSERPSTRTRRSFMLVVKSEARLPLPRLSLLVPDLWLFVVSQSLSNGTVVWLVSSGIDQPEGLLNSRPPEAARVVAGRLRFLLPSIFESDSVQFASYEGLKSDVVIPHQTEPPIVAPTVCASPDLSVMLVSPTKLTLAPVASEMVLELIDARGIKPSHRPGEVLPSDLRDAELMIGDEKWDSVDFRPWHDFIEDLESRGFQCPLEPDQGPESASRGRMASPPPVPYPVRQLLGPLNQRIVRTFYHCERVTIRRTPPTAISGGESGAKLVDRALKGLGSAPRRNVKEEERSEVWAEQKQDNLILLDSPGECPVDRRK
jgi:glycine/D-amino acid oxidase-like deaminating enzyme